MGGGGWAAEEKGIITIIMASHLSHRQERQWLAPLSHEHEGRRLAAEEVGGQAQRGAVWEEVVLVLDLLLPTLRPRGG
jgi:hypothetical protein